VPDERLDLYRRMRLVREFECALAEIFASGELAGTTHSAAGQEAVAVGVSSALEPADLVVSNHRGHGHLLAKGGSPERLAAEIFGRSTGYAAGRGGSQHFSAREIGFLGSNGITGGGLPIAVGAALAIKRTGDRRIVVPFFGDGASNQGTFHESLNMAALWKLPVLFVCENNGWSFSTRTEEGTARPRARSSPGFIARRAEGYGIEHACVDGNDVGAVRAATRKAAVQVRSGGGPFLLECMTWRLHGHSKSDGCEYRSREEEDRWRARCPLVRLANEMQEDAAVTGGELETVDREVEREVAAAIERARAAPPPAVETAAAGVYATPLDRDSSDPSADDAGCEERYGWQAVNAALAEALERDGRVLLLGQDIAGYGGAFKVTRGLAERFGEERVVNAPISENSLVGACAGAALVGLRPVIEMMFMDFVLLAFDQIANHAAKFHYMYGLDARVPLVIRCPAGGYRGYGPTHSQSLEALFQGVAGLKIVCPGRVRDIRGLLAAAILDDDPVLFVEHKLLYGARGPVSAESEVIPLGRARVARAGRDLTITAHGYMVELALRAAGALAAEGVETEVVDLRTIKPLDEGAILESIRRTQRLVTVEEGARAGGIGAEVASLASESAMLDLDGPVVRVGAPDAPIPAARVLEDAVLPSVADIIAAARRALGR